MRTLRSRDAAALLDLVAELHELDEPLPFPPRVLASLARLIPADEVTYALCDAGRQWPLLQVWHQVGGDEGVVAGDAVCAEPREREVFLRVRESNPVYAYRAATGDWTTPYKVSDFVTLRQFRRTPYYAAFIRGLADYSLDVGLVGSSERRQTFAFWRVGCDFGERDRLMLRLLQPHLTARAEAAATAADAAAALAAVEDGGGEAPAHVVLASRKGVIEYASAASRALLASYLAVKNGTLPPSLFARRELVLRQGGGRLRVRVAPTADLYVLLLDEEDLRVERLTLRELEIVDAVACGKQNDAIALELGIAPGTVAKHLQHIYRKMGVTNRTAAAVLRQSGPVADPGNPPRRGA